MALMTRWGYVVDADELPPVLTVDEFDAVGGSELASTDAAKAAALAAASQAIRDYCGWHVSPRLKCTFEVDADSSATLPVMGVDPSTVEFGEVEERTQEVMSCGVLLRRPVRVQSLTCYAGTDSDAIKQVCAQLATNHLVATAGLREEHIGTAGATYNQTDNGVSGGIRLLASDRELLDPYHIVGVA